MNLKQFSLLGFCLATIILLTSCNEKGDDITLLEPSKNAQITSFSLKSTATNAVDSLNFPILANTKFTVVNRARNEIYNVDSLPKGIRIGKMSTTITFASTPSKIELLYPKDSVVVWNSTDSIDFSLYEDGYPEIQVTAQDGRSTRRYSVEFRIHKLNPDSIGWQKQTNLPVAGASKTICSQDGKTFYTMVKTSGVAKLYYASHVSGKNSLVWNEQTTNLPNASKLQIESFVSGEGILAILSDDGKSYVSTDNGATWTTGAAMTTIVGKLPLLTTDNKNDFLVIYKKTDGKVVFGKTADFIVVKEVTKLDGYNDNSVPDDFPVLEFSAVDYDLANVNKLLLTGGFDSKGDTVKSTWLIDNNSKESIEAIPGGRNTKYPQKNGVTTFVYNEMLYVLAQDSLYTSTSFGDRWSTGNKNQFIDPKMKGNHKPSILVDKDDFIWVFGGVSASNKYSSDVWRGRLNKLASKHNTPQK